MLKSFCKIIVFFIILMLLIPFFAQATDVNMNLTANTTEQNTSTVDTSTTQTQTTTDNLSPTSTNYSNNSATISTLNELPESGLGLNNVINIILIVIGVLLILLGIAILIRLKH